MITIELDSREVNAALHTLELSVANMQPVFERIGAAIENNILRELGQGKSARGIPFDPLLKPRPRGSGVGDVPLNDTSGVAG